MQEEGRGQSQMEASLWRVRIPQLMVLIYNAVLMTFDLRWTDP